MCFIANFIEMNHIVCLSALAPDARRHFVDMERLRLIFTEGINVSAAVNVTVGRLLALLNAQWHCVNVSVKILKI